MKRAIADPEVNGVGLIVMTLRRLALSIRRADITESASSAEAARSGQVLTALFFMCE